MKNRALMAFALLVLAALVLAAGSAVYSQEDVTTVRDSAFGNRMRPPVPFLHDDHNEKAGIDECNVCHHVVEDGQLLADESTIDSLILDHETYEQLHHKFIAEYKSSTSETYDFT
ncbi:MAG: cytochrome c3 family protein, partial [Desulfobacterales bacterium]